MKTKRDKQSNKFTNKQRNQQINGQNKRRKVPVFYHRQTVWHAYDKEDGRKKRKETGEYVFLLNHIGIPPYKMGNNPIVI